MTDREQIKALFQDAIDLNPTQRKKFLAAMDPAIREEVEALLAAHDDAGAFLAPSTPQGEAPGDLIGPYKLLQQIGEGGFGIVYMAEQAEPVRRKVALKIIRLGMDTKQVIARFEAERQALALMDHPNIAKVFDAGSTKTGRPYFVMELVKGIPITEFCDQAGMTTAQRLELFQQVCLAVQHAHQKGIIHRDLKPSNILVTLHDGRPVPMVIDFGIAKATNQPLTEKTLFTEFRQMIGTPEYMAPEQAELSGLDVDTRADIYSLGVLLYELLTGSKPFDLRSLLNAGFDEMLRHIREVDPPKPSTRISTLEDLPSIAQRRHTRPKVLGRELRGDLDWIVMKALEKDRSRRYETASEFALDIGRYLADQTVIASPPSASYRARKFVRRHRVGVLAGTVVAAGLLTGLALALAGMMQASDERDRARIEAKRANTVTELIESLFASWNPNTVKGANYKARELLDELDVRFRTAKDEPEVEAHLRRVAGNAYRGLGIPDKAEPHLRRAYELGLRLYGNDHPFITENRLSWAGLLSDQGNLEDAVRTFQAVLERGPNSSAQRGLANARVELGRFAEAEQAARAALEQSEDEEQKDLSRISLAWALKNRGQLAEAERFVREALEARGKRMGENHPSLSVALNTLGMILADRNRREDAERCFRQALRIWEHAYGRPDESVLRNLAAVRLTLGFEKEAEELCTRAVESCRTRLGPRHRETASALVDLGDARRYRSDFHGAHALYEEALGILQATIGRNTLEYVEVVRALAQAKEALGRYDEALELQRELVKLSEKFYGARSLPTSNALHNLASTLSELSREIEALPHQRRALEIFVALGIEDELGLSNRLNGLGILLTHTGAYDEAEAALRRALEIRKRRLGRVHDYTATSYNNLGLILHDRGDHKRAAQNYEEAIKILEEIHGGDHFEAAMALGNLGSAKIDVEEYATAVGYLERSLALRRTHLGPDHPSVGLVRHHLAVALGEMGRTDAALEHNADALRIRRAALGAHHQETLRTLRIRGKLFFDSMRYAQAVAPFRESHRHWPRKDGPEAIMTALHLSFALRCSGKTDEAAEILKQTLRSEQPGEVVKVLESISYGLSQHARFKDAEHAVRVALRLEKSQDSPDESMIATLQFRLASVLDASGKPDEAEALLRQVLPVRKRLFGEKSSAYAATLAGLASALHVQGKLPEADRLLTRSIKIESELHGDDYVELPVLINNLAGIRAAMGRLDDAERLARDALARGRKLFGKQSARNAMLLAQLAGLLSQKGEHVEALPIIRECFELSRREFGASNAQALGVQIMYGEALRNAGKPKEAKATCEAALRGFVALNPRDPTPILWARLHLGWACQELKEWPRSLELAIQIRTELERTMGRANPIWVQATYLLVFAYKNTEQLKLEETVLRQLVTVTRPIEGYPRVDFARDVVMWVDCLVRLEKFAEAEPLAREAVAIRDKVLPPGHWHIFSARIMLGRSLAGQRKFAEAEKLLVENYPKMNPPPAAMWGKRDAKAAIIKMYEAWGKPTEAEAWRKR